MKLDPALRVILRENVPLAGRTTLRIGGPARYLAEAHDLPALLGVLREAAGSGLRVLPLGKGSNILVPDAGFDGVALVLAGDFQAVRIDGEHAFAGGGASLTSLAVRAKNAGLSGLEGLSGIPSSVGGAIRINAGAYGTEIFDVLVAVALVTRSGEPRTVPAGTIRRGYRFTELMEGDDIVTGAALKLRARPIPEIEARLEEVAAKRRRALPAQPNAGSIFKNPPGNFAGRLLELCGLKGCRIGGAEVSCAHANVIVNAGGATAGDVRALMAVMRAAARERFGVDLVPEIEVIPEPKPAEGPRP